MTVDRKPAVLIVHGSWHRPCHYEFLTRQLEKLGFEAVCPALPSIGKDRLGKSWRDDVMCVREAAQQLFDRNQQVVLLGHSYGGIPASAATEGLTRLERAAAGLPGGFCHAIYLSAFALPARNLSLLQAVGGCFPDWMEFGEVGSVSKDRSTFVNEKAAEVLYNDLSHAQIRWALGELVPQSQSAVEHGIPFSAADVATPKTFIICEKDRAMTVDVQEMLIAAIPEMMSHRIDTGHSPFLSKPEELAHLVADISQASWT
ncbi:Alpha/beta hydrolase fold-1 [Microdochium trichocladiopsis]|uniref:Alpha/beta hydrolase fold-1 n=1 Tax=Microdochium trichocladiopsis TaxID=1682393 RepID=A0A9P9BRW0_9PEZI|nr:Alpha/beta hydrolase fold-1 [Microdochium trichocladiopsis]KAH7027685.1 Alpha/beta hydrolase fold-1 [Microdochium trichocladiopsis]